MANEIHVIVATIAFGMGINKSDVRFVIHYSLPKSLEGYVQECGRGGRDGKKAECILFYSYGDRQLNDWFIVNNRESNGRRKNENLHALYSILDYCEEPFTCRRKLQLSFLGEEFDESKCKRQCDNCKKHLKVVEVDLTEEAIKIVKMVIDFGQNNASVTVP